ncbi:hypothetical protein [Phreatobacter oligotrophus]|uniref:Uncharacterized protein n=1 Tax=Phreatobacter oligotrophus TaxID=1122261 RepID=A0A2T4ZIS2_9HYPH|nr:hypothetical protein [Phreatobacter oligotrophus]PTM61892.1 hypothetical protein C8P69_101564 [Phreatobacter oligotrophus]
MAEVDISRWHFRRPHGMFMAIGTWCQHGIGEWRRCLVIMRRGSFGSDDLRIFVVHDDVDLPTYAVDLAGMGDKQLAWTLAGKACEQLDIEDNAANRVAILTIINDNMYELVMMPPAPKRDQVVFGDVVMKERESGRIIEREMRTDV